MEIYSKLYLDQDFGKKKYKSLNLPTLIVTKTSQNVKKNQILRSFEVIDSELPFGNVRPYCWLTIYLSFIMDA